MPTKKKPVPPSRNKAKNTIATPPKPKPARGSKTEPERGAKKASPAAMPKIADFMSRHPQTIGRDQPLTVAHAMMQKFRIRHLPVLHGGQLVGLLSQRDLHLIETIKDVDPATVPVEEAMSQQPTVMRPDAPLVDAAVEMARNKLGSVIVAEGRKVVGVFTTVDACRALLAMLGRRVAEA